MFTGIYQSMTVLATAVVYYILDFVLIGRYDRHRQDTDSGRSWGYTTMILATTAFLVIQPLFLPWLGIRVRAWWGALAQAIGLLVIAGAQILHTWGRVHLRQVYTERVELQPEHLVVNTGPYAHVRHPTFTSFFLYVIGLLLVNPALPTLLVAIYTFWDFGRAAKQEEVLLGEKLPGYADYMARTPRFVPRLRRHTGDN